MDTRDYHSTRLTASGSVFGSRARVVAVHAISTGTAGSITLKDGGSSGTAVLQLDTPGTADQLIQFVLPEGGILCETNLYCTLTNVTRCTVVYA